MSQPNYMIVDGVLGDYVQDICVYIDQLNGDNDGKLEELAAQLMGEDNDSEENQEKIFKAIAENTAVLAKAPEKEFEATYNMVLHILTFSTKLTEILPVVLKHLQTDVPSYTNGPVMVLSVLANLYNILPANSPLRYQVFMTILEFAQETNNVQMLQDQLKYLSQWVDEWGVDSETKKSLYARLSEVLTASNLNAQTSYKYLYDACLESESTELSSKLVQTALASDFVYDFDRLFGLSSVQSLKGQNVFNLLEVVSNGDYEAFKSATVDVPNPEAVKAKAKVMALSKRAYTKTQETSVSSSGDSGATITYDEIAKAIDVSKDEVELSIIDAIRAGLIEGRLCQMEERFDIHRATPVGKFGAEEWKQVQTRLTEWRQSLNDVLEVVKNARENAVKEKQNKNKQHQKQSQQSSQQQVTA